MNKKTAMKILKKSHEAQEILFSLFDEHLREKIKEDKNRDDIDGKIYKCIFTSYHTIMNSLQDEIFKEYQDIKKKFNEYIESKYQNK